MKIFRVDFDANHYQSLFPRDEELWRTGMLTLDGMEKDNQWTPPKLFCLKPKLRKGDFYGGNVGGLITSPETTEMVRAFFEMAGELLPLTIENERRPFCLLNVTECLNVLDADRCEWFLDPDTGQRLLIKKYAFHKNFTESTLFKIPETCRGEVLTIERTGNSEEEFKAFVEEKALRGLLFQELWSDE